MLGGRIIGTFLFLNFGCFLLIHLPEDMTLAMTKKIVLTVKVVGGRVIFAFKEGNWDS